MSAFKASIVILGVALFVLYSSVFIVDEREKALIVRFGEINRTINSPGFYFKLPFVDERIKIEDRIVFFESPDKIVQVMDGRRYQADAIAMWWIVDPRKFRETVDASLTCPIDRWKHAQMQRSGKTMAGGARCFYQRSICDDARNRDQVRSETLWHETVDGHQAYRSDARSYAGTHDRTSAERLAEAALLQSSANPSIKRGPRQIEIMWN
jgi:membrane protease subunit HflC